jgi:indolepyruvate ferredoxin oxidoreductase
VLDQTGLAQKGGAVTTHIRIARTPEDIHAVRIAAGEADVVLGCDMVVVNDYWVLSKVRGERSQVVLNTYQAMPGTFTTRPDMEFPAAGILSAVTQALGGRAPLQVDATVLATALMGDAIAANLFMLGYAWQQGLVPISFEAIMRAVELNGAAVEMNRQAFAWGRLAVVNPAAVAEAAGVIHNAQTESERTPHNLQILPPGEWETSEWASPSAPRTPDNEHEVRGLQDAGSHDGNVAFLPLDDLRLSRSLDELIQRRVAFLTEYQNAAYANRYSALVDKVRDAEHVRAPGSTALSEAVARYFFKLMAYKDEYEVARLYTSGDFKRKLEQQFDGDYKLHFHLAPPLLAKKDAQGRLIKQEFGPWVFSAFRLMAKFRFLRGGMFDIFGYTEERKGERKLIGDYEKTIGVLLASLNADNLPLAAEIASIPEHIRGYGHVKEAHLHKAKAREAALLDKWNNPREIPLVQAA